MGHLNVVSQFPVLSAKLDQHAEHKRDRLLRQMEYTEALIENFVHPAVQCVHLLLERDEDEAFIIQQIQAYPYADRYTRFIPEHIEDDNDAQRLWHYAKQCERIRFVKLGRWMLYSDAFGYARQLAGRLCVVQNSDISLSLAPEHIEAYNRLAEKTTNNHANDEDTDASQRQPLRPLFTTREGRNKVFALSRSHVKLPSCPAARVRACDGPAKTGSYDTFIFVSPLPEALEWQVVMPQNIWGAENRVIWTLKCLNISVTNPCHQLATVHHHCKSAYRPTQQKDPPGLPRVKYDQHGPLAFPPRAPAGSIEYDMTTPLYPAYSQCFFYPWNGPEGKSPEERAIEAANPPNTEGNGWQG